MMAEVYKIKQDQKVEAELTFAWMNAYYQRVEKLDSLKECLDEALGRVNKEEMTDDAMLEMAQRLNAMFGGTVEGEDEETED